MQHLFDIQLPLGAVVATFLLFELKQLLGDYVLQNDWMAQGKNAGEAWAGPLAAHAGVHAAGTLLIALAVNPDLWWLAILDFFIHGSIDFSKARIGRAAAVTPFSQRFWCLFGVDQQMHAMTHLCLAVALIAA